MNCGDCKYCKKVNQHKGNCELWGNYVKLTDSCDDGEE